MLNRWNRLQAGMIGLACLLLFSSGCSLLPTEEEVLKPPLVVPQKESYNLYEVQRGTIVKQVSGTAAFESTTIAKHHFSGAAGKISEIFVEPGDKVSKGDPLMQLDNPGLDIVVMERERDFLKAQLALRQAKESRDEALIRIRLLELSLAEYELNEVRQQLEGIVLTAEIDGIVVAMERVRIGDTVQPDRTYVTVSDPGSLRLAYSGPVTEALKEVEVGMKAEITYNDKKLEGTVVQSPSSAPPTEDEALRSKYERAVYIELANADDYPELTERNATANIVIALQTKENAIIVPRRAVYALLARNIVKVMDGESIREVDIEKGIETPAETEIVKGLEEGQMIILQ